MRHKGTAFMKDNNKGLVGVVLYFLGVTIRLVALEIGRQSSRFGFHNKPAV
jgi:hypothetical protein